ncbi:MAG: efflux transporter outer membrane subunit [Planctomycetota bacterium]|jgi:NodT family efflux transporter outer membrane factor (OMF) lipoprotein
MRKKVVSKCLMVLVSTAVAGTGCMVGPKYERPETAADTNDGYFNADGHITDVNDFGDAGMWWQRFGDPTTAELVRRMLESNYDLKASAARVLQAQAMLAQAHGGRFPDVVYGLNRDRSKVSFNLGALGGGRFSFMNTTWSQNISVAYIVDFFGKLKHAERAAWAQLFAAESNEQALTNSMIATVIEARVNVATLQKQLTITRANMKSRRETLRIVERRYGEGLVGPVDVRLARENLEASLALEPGIELLLIRAHYALDVLLGHRPGGSEQLPNTLAELPDLEPVRIGLPAALLDRRPDVRAAELMLRAANEEIGVSIAQLYPDLALVANYGSSADRWRDIWEHFSETYSALIGLSQPIFTGGRLRAQVDAAEARHAELAANYAGTVLTAMREVEDALITEQMLQKELEHTELRFEEATAAEGLSQERYQRGVDSILTVLETERRRRIAEELLVILKARIWTTRVNLHLALGGDWNEQEQSDE